MRRNLLIVCGVLAYATHAGSYYTVGDLEYEYTHHSRNATVFSVSGSQVVVPSSVRLPLSEGWADYKVVRIGDDGPVWRDALVSLDVEGDLDEIDQMAFYHCKTLKNVSLHTVDTISWEAFMGCTNLSEIVWQSVSYIDGFAFHGCTSLKSAKWPKEGGFVGEAAFSQTGIEQVVVPSTMSFGSSVFSGCQSLTSIVFQDGVRSVSDGIVSDCPNLCKVSIPDGVAEIGWQSFQECVSLSSIRLPDTVHFIGQDAFCSDTNLVGVNVPSALTGIGSGAFALTAVTNIDLSAQKIVAISNDTFNLCKALKHIGYPKQLEEIGDEAFSHSAITNGDLSSFPLRKIGDRAFAYCNDLAHVVLPETLEYIGESAFRDIGLNGRPVHAMLDDKTYEETMEIITSKEYQDALSSEIANPTFGAIEFLGPPPQMGWSVFSFEDEYKESLFYVKGTYPAKYESEWQAAIAEWDAAHGTTNEWHGLKFTENISIEVEPTAWEMDKSQKGGQTLTIGWHLPTNENFTTEQALEALPKKGKYFAVWRSCDDEKAYSNFVDAVCIANNVTATNYVDKTFGAIKGTHPVCYWVEIQEQKESSSSPEDHNRPNEIPATCMTRRRFGLVIGLGVYEESAYAPNDLPHGLPGFRKDAVLFSELLKKCGGVEKEDDVRLLTDSGASLSAIQDALKNLPYDANGKERTVPGDIVFLWISSHGDGGGGFAAYNGPYFSNSTSYYPGHDWRNTFVADLAWVRQLTGVRLVGILPFCHAEKFYAPLTGLPNVAWIGATEAAEESLVNPEGTQYADYFLHEGLQKSMASMTHVLGTPFAKLEQFRVQTIGDGRNGVSYGELARYAGSLSFGFSETKPAHGVICNTNVLNGIVAASKSAQNGFMPGFVQFRAESTATGMIALHYRLPASAKELILWYRKDGEDTWHWSNLIANWRYSNWDEDKSNFYIIGEDTIETELLQSGYNRKMFFGIGSEHEEERLGVIESNTRYFFRVQGVNEYGYGPTSEPLSATTGFRVGHESNTMRMLNVIGRAIYEGTFQGDKLMPVEVSAVAGDADVSVVVVIDHGGNPTTYSGIGVPGTDDRVHVVCSQTSNSKSSLTRMMLAAASEVTNTELPETIELSLDVNGVIGSIGDTPLYCGLISEYDLEDDCVGEFVNLEYGVDTSYGPYVPGAAVSETIPDSATWKVTGLPTGLKWDAKLPGVTGTPTKPGTNTVYFTWTEKVSATSNVNHKASSTFIVGPLPTVTVVAVGETNGCKVTGSGAYLANKSVTLKATAATAKKATAKAPAQVATVFAGWYGSDPRDGERGALGDRPLPVSLAPSYALTMPARDVTLYAKFVAQTDDVAAISFALPDEMTNGVTAVNTAVDVSGCSSLPTVKVTGLPTGLMFTAKALDVKATKTTAAAHYDANTIYGTPTKSGVYTVTVTVTTAGKATATETFKVIVRAEGEAVVDADWETSKGKVTGMGICAKGKTLTLKAVANKGYVFAGWYSAAAIPTCGDEACAWAYQDPVEGAADYRTASLAVKGDGNDVTYYARFVAASEDDGIRANVEDEYALNGAWSMKLDIDSLSLPSVTVKGLPTGLKFDAKTLTISGTPTKPGVYTVTLSLKNTTVKKAKTQTFKINVANIESPYLAGVSYATDAYNYRGGVAVAWNIGPCATDGYTVSGVSGLPSGLKYNAKTGRIEGVPSKAGTYTATITLKNGKATSAATVTLNVAAIDPWAYGTFNGGSDDGQVQLAITSAGKLTGKYLEDGITYTLAATSFSDYDDGAYHADVTASWSYKEGNKTVKQSDVRTLVVEEGDIGGIVTADEFTAWQNVWTQSAWKDFGSSHFGRSGTTQKLSGAEYGLGDGESITMTIKSNGAVTLKGTFDTGVVKNGKPVYYAASGSAVVCATDEDPFSGQVFVYFAPNAAKNFNGYVRTVTIGEE